MLAARHAAAIVLLAFIAALLPGRGAAEEEPPHLVDQVGRQFTLSDLERVPVVVTFVSAHCTDVCPIVNAMTADAVHRVEREHLKARFLTVTLDPERDSRGDLRAMANRFGADPARWIVAGGTSANVHAIMREFGVVAKRGRTYVEAHSTLIYILANRGRLHTTLLVSSDVASRIVAALRIAQGLGG